MKIKLDYIWPVIGLMAVIGSCWLLYKEVHTTSLVEVGDALRAISWHHYLLAALATLGAYWALAWYDRIALIHLGHRLSWFFISVVSFTSYALAHNIGASVISGAIIRYRAYSTKGLSAAETTMLAAFCTFTFAFGCIVISAFVFIGEPGLVSRLIDIPLWVVRLTGFIMLAGIVFYVAASAFHLPSLKIRNFTLSYPNLPVTIRQLIAGPLEIMSAAAIIYFTLPEQGNPGYFIILGIFVISFSLALLSHAPGGLGVLEYTFVLALPEMAKPDVLAALIVFRAFYLIIPLLLSIPVIVLFERAKFMEAIRKRKEAVVTG